MFCVIGFEMNLSLNLSNGNELKEIASFFQNFDFDFKCLKNNRSSFFNDIE